MKTFLVAIVALAFLVLSVCVICFVIQHTHVGSASSVDSSGYSTADLIAAVTEQLTSIDTLYIEFEDKFSNSTDTKKLQYARSGNMWHFMEPTSDGNENIDCCDGSYEYTFIVGNPRENRKNWDGGQIHDFRQNERTGPEGLLGMVFNLRRSIADVFKSAKEVTSSAQILPDGTSGLRLITKDVAKAIPNERGGGRYIVEVTLDPAHDFLPREVLVTSPESPNWAENWKVVEYRQVLDERTGKKRWFPVAGILEWGPNSIKTNITIHNVRINSDLPFSLFRPEFPVGVTPNDLTTNGIDSAEAAKLKMKIYRTPTLQERIAAEFNQPGEFGARLDSALLIARLRFQRVLIVFAKPQSEIIEQFYKLYFDGEHTDIERLFNEYCLLAINSSDAKADAAATFLKNRLGAEQISPGQSMLLIVDINGKLLATGNASSVSNAGEIDHDLFAGYLESYAGEKPDAAILLAEALAQADSENKCVLLQETGAFCGPCLSLSRFLDAHRDTLAEDYIMIKIDSGRFPNGKETMRPIRTSKNGGIPWMAILDPKGNMLINSDGPNGNIGNPNKPESIEHFMKMLANTAHRLTPEQLAALRKDLEAAYFLNAKEN
jgi:hypothetical protein